MPKLHALGIRAELWLGNDDSLVSARHLLQRPNETATALLDLARQNSFISGFNIDLEAGGGTVVDGLLHRTFLEQVSGMLSHAGLRLSSDVACSNFAGILGRPLASNCSLLGSANLHGGRIMNMGTYNAGSYDLWVSALDYSFEAPLHNLGVGLGVYTKTPSWNTNASSAADRICALLNHSVSEIDIFDLQPPTAPEHFWLAQLRKYKKGGGCDMKVPQKVVCPQGRVAGSWRPGGEGADCCESNARRSPSISCNITCAKAECAASHGRWAPKNYSHHPFECCGATTLRSQPLKADDSMCPNNRRLYNGICLPPEFPPRVSNYTSEPDTVAHPPPLINISIGRQLFVDSFLVESSAGTRLQFHTATPHPANPILSPTEPWEEGEAQVMSGGVWWYEGRFHAWYSCGSSIDGATCHAVSDNGLTWLKPKHNGNTNIVNGTTRSNTVWLDWDETDPSKRFKLAEERAANGNRALTLHSSRDGLTWRVEVEKTGQACEYTTNPAVAGDF